MALACWTRSGRDLCLNSHGPAVFPPGWQEPEPIRHRPGTLVIQVDELIFFDLNDIVDVHQLDTPFRCEEEVTQTYQVGDIPGLIHEPADVLDKTGVRTGM